MRALAPFFGCVLTVVGLALTGSVQAARESGGGHSHPSARPVAHDTNARNHHQVAGTPAQVRGRSDIQDRLRKAQVAALLEGREAKVTVQRAARDARSSRVVRERPSATLRGGARTPTVSAQRALLSQSSLSQSSLGQSSLSHSFDSPRSEAFAGRRSIARATGLHTAPDPLDLNSAVVLVLDQESGRTLYEKNAGAVLPIASITKLMTAMVVLETGDSLQELIEITEADVDTEKHSSSRVRVGTTLTRAELLQLALMSSENRAAHALARRSRLGLTGFVAAMNAKARALGMSDTQYSDPTGLSSRNVSTARDLSRLVRVAADQPLVRQFSTATDMIALVPNQQVFRNTNRLIRSGDWEIDVSKTGYISEAGRCLVMQVRIQGRPTTVVLLDAFASQARTTDAMRIRRWLETPEGNRITTS
jgi:D-alanyl-D-alanine endopeptidase (penicillin-binding protein 7)